MNEVLELETARLSRAWMRHDALRLRDYLVADVEDPRLNVQSILSRHFLACALWGDRFRELMDAELRFAVVMNWLLQVRTQVADPEGWQAIAAALRTGSDNAEGIEVPACVHRARALLGTPAQGMAMPDYLGRFLDHAGAPVADAGSTTVADQPGSPEWGEPRALTAAWEAAADTFLRLWRAALSSEPVSGRLTVIEPGCGSANDYRYIESSGLARCLDYAGFDLCAKNVANARALFPATRFEVGNAFALPAPDRAFDCGLVHDLFEHLSLEGLAAAVAELCRVTRRGLCLGFFQMDEIEDHIVRETEEYHVNTLSLARTLDLFRQQGFTGEAIHVGTFLRLRFGGGPTPNPNAYTLVLKGPE